MDCAFGKSVWFEKQEINPCFDATIASCSVPVISPIVKYKDYDLLDGGICDPIPIEKSIADGNKFHVIVLNRNKGYIKTEFKYKLLLNIFYKKYPQVINAVLNRHEVYNRQLKLCEKLEQEGKAVIIRPKKPLQVSRTGTDIQKLLALYDEGHEEGKDIIKLLEKL